MPLSNTSQAISAGLGMRGDLRQRVLAAAEPHFQPQRGRSRRERRQRIGRLLRRERQPRQGDIQQAKLARPQPVAAAAAVQPVRRRLQRPKAAFSAGTRSVFSHVKVPFSSSGSRPKWPYAEVGT